MNSMQAAMPRRNQPHPYARSPQRRSTPEIEYENDTVYLQGKIEGEAD